MGLDMCLEEKISMVGYNASNKNEVININLYGEDDTLKIKLCDIKSIRIEIAYWRKANMIHKYIVDNHASGVDECQEIEVSCKDLLELQKICKEVLMNHNKAPELLPITSGFFFGGDDYEEWYYEDIQFTFKMIEELNIKKDDARWFIYRASW